MKPVWKISLLGLGVLLGAEIVHDGVRRLARHRLPPQPPAEVVVGRELWIGDRSGADDAPGAGVVDLRHDGWTSAEWAERLPELLAIHAPEQVVAWLGAEDLRRRSDRRAEPAVPALQEHRFRSFWLGLFESGGAGESSEQGEQALLGVWHLGQVLVEFRADGGCRLGDIGGFWTSTGSRSIRLELIGAEPTEVDFERAGDELILRGAGVGGTFPLRRGAPPERSGDLVHEAILRGRLDEARHLLGPSRVGALRDPNADVLWVELHVACGDRGTARAGLDTLRAAADRSVDDRRRLARGLLALGDVEEALAVAAGDLAAFVISRPFRIALSRVVGAADRAKVVTALEAVEEPNADVHWLLSELQQHAVWRLGHALRWCRALGGSGAIDVREAPRIYAEVEADDLERMAEAFGFDDAATIARFRSLREEWLEADAETREAFRENEVLLVMIAAAAGCAVLAFDADSRLSGD